MFPTIQRNGVRSLWQDPTELLGGDFNRLINRVFNETGVERTDLIGNYPVDVHEDAEHIYVDAEMPGFKKEEIGVTLEDGVLTIRAERKSEESTTTKHLTERRYSRVQRSFSLPTSVDASKVDAKLADGVLHLVLNKQEAVKPRKIEIQ